MNAIRTSRYPAAGRTLPLLLAVSLLAVTAAGCKHTDDPGQPVGWHLVDASQRHPILVSQKPATMSVRVPRGSQRLTPAQRAQVIEFAHHFQATDAGNSRLVVTAPGGGSNEVAAMNASQEIRELLLQRGFPESSISLEAYSAERQHEPPIRVSYMTYVAEAPPCGNWSTNLAREPGNLPYPNFGCSTQHNFAAQIANPADLLGPRNMTGRPDNRRAVVWEKYVKGETTSAAKSADETVKTQGGD